MAWTFSHDVAEYDDAAGGLLRADASRHTIGVNVIDSARRRATPLDPPELFGWWTDSVGNVTGCASITPPWPLLLDCVEESTLPSLAVGLRDRQVELAGVNGPTELAATFAVIWRSLSEQRVLVHDALRLFQLGSLIPPKREVDGSARLATDDDFALAVDWYVRFGVEVHGPMANVEPNVKLRLADEGIWLWCNSDGEPVSLASRTPAISGVARIGPVFTPRDQRGRGYAEALTYALSRSIVDEGSDAVLFTDQANPTSNGIYTRLGYEPVMDRVMLTFE